MPRRSHEVTMARVRERVAKRIVRHGFIHDEIPHGPITAQSLGIESVTHMAPSYSGGNSGIAVEYFAVSLPRLRFLEPPPPRGEMPADSKGSPPPPEPALSAGTIPGGQG